MSITLDNVTVRLARDADDFRRYIVTVQVASRTKPEFKASNNVDPGKAVNQKELFVLIGAAGAACAEYMGEKYNEDVDPGHCGKVAIRAFVEECRLQVEMAKDVGPKLKRLKEHSLVVLTDAERELLVKCEWTLNHDQKLTPVEVEWINQCLARVHTSQLH